MKYHQLLILLSIISFFKIQGVIAQSILPTSTPDRITLHLGEDPETAFSVGFRTSIEVEEAFIEISPENNSPEFDEQILKKKADRKMLDSDGVEAHYFSVNVTGLDPGKLYVYRVGSEDAWSEWIQVSTASKNMEAFSFIYLGDIQNGIKSLASRVVRKSLMHQPTASFMLYAGDLINRTHNDHEWGEWYGTGGWAHAQIPILATPGNHEYTRDEQRNLQLDNHWDKQFCFPKNGPIPHQSSVYYQDFGNMQIICLDSQLIMLDSVSRHVQRDWLEEILKNTQNQWKVVLMHHPVYSVSDKRDNPILRELFQPLFEKYKVDIVFQGHDHTYGRGFKPDIPEGASKGPMYVVSVAGPKMYTPSLDRWMERAGANIQLYQIISINKNQLQYESFTADGKKYDGFDLIKNTNGNKFKEHENLDPESTRLPKGRLEKLSPEEIATYNRIYNTNY
ncbi:metallophosphoesterase family protein [Belliella sp. R4-6]|uniref:Metallophosphoesterase family protein n=1 Tax=Belliella alkalica TaxID=1730871 RepID=A0ABS9VGH3_9BACT|nr:metallophosphoesterase family protein [Belliella alkalica]MCH7415269.1 metallophosphoesterase family protein [Belliella alkalica]